MTVAGMPPEDRYALTLHMRKEYRKTLKVAATLASDSGMIGENNLTELMNLFVNLGLEYVRTEALRVMAPESNNRETTSY